MVDENSEVASAGNVVDIVGDLDIDGDITVNK